MTTTNDTLRGNIEAALRLLLKSEKDYLRRAAEVGIEDLGLLVARLDEKLSVESADAWLAHRFNEVFDEKKRLEEQLGTRDNLLRDLRHALRSAGHGPEYGRPGELDGLCAVIDATIGETPVRPSQHPSLRDSYPASSLPEYVELEGTLADGLDVEPTVKFEGAHNISGPGAATPIPASRPRPTFPLGSSGRSDISASVDDPAREPKEEA